MERDGTSRRRRRRRGLVLVGLALLSEALVLALRGYRPIGGRVVVRCRSGHLYTTTWLPLGSLKALRFGWWRFQRCPVGPHWSFVSPVRRADLAPGELELAEGRRDLAIP